MARRATLAIDCNAVAAVAFTALRPSAKSPSLGPELAVVMVCTTSSTTAVARLEKGGGSGGVRCVSLVGARAGGDS